MAHCIDESTGQAAVFVTGEPAWHKLGKVIESAANSAEAVKLAGLDWTVEKRNLAAALPGGGWSPVNGHFANVRTDTDAALGVVSASYRIFQNSEAFDFMDSLVGERLAMYETAGALHGGKRVWMMARVPGEFRAGTDDVVNPYVLLTNSHDGSSALRMIPTSVRVVCQNTLNLALGRAGSQGISIRHFDNLDRRVEEARESLGIIGKRFEAFGQEIEQLAETKMNEAQAKAYFEALLAKPAQLDNDPRSDFDKIIDAPRGTKAAITRDRAIVDQWLANFENERQRLAGIEGSAWAAFNSVSEWADHQKPARGKTENEKANSRLNSVWFGAGDDLKQRAYASALQLASN